ncbi:MAG: sigma 54-interacting transcriptional regulator [Limisphaerales bacterium]
MPGNPTHDHGGVDDTAILRLVVAGTAAETGTEFFRALVRNLSLSLGTMGAWATEYLPTEKRLRAFGMWMGGRYVDRYEYPIAGTACERVVEHRELIHIPERLVELFPRDDDLVPLGAVSYLGAPLLDTHGGVMGHLGVLDNKPMPRDERAVALFEIFTARAAAEMRRLKIAEELGAREEQLSTLLETAMDAILVLDESLAVARVNQAAQRLFGCTAEDLLGESILDFLVKDSGAQLGCFARELQARPAGRQQLWVPQDFVARRCDHSVFPAEVTLSRFTSGGAGYYTMILRNVDERKEAERQIELLMQETEYLREAMRELPGAGSLIGRSDCMQAVSAAIQQVAGTDSTVLIAGETGTGKELVARSIHQSSARAEKPLVLVNCAAIPGNLIESEFFGHERGAFTGAVNRRDGRFALAHGGTLFLDEIGELPLELQSKLLRVLQEGEFEPLGSSKTVRVDVRVIAASHRNLKQMVGEGRFREDLFFRLNVFPIRIPPLRERGRDVELLASEFVRRFARRMGRRIGPLDDSHLGLLRGYDWPGNVRELQNVIERAVILSSGSELQLQRAMAGFTAAPTPAPSLSGAAPDPSGERVLTAEELQELERANLLRALESCGWRVSGEGGAARLIGVPASTLSSRMKTLGVRRSPASRS